jgi:hypothetical protein
MGCATGDVDGDGDLDLFVSNFGPDVLLLNRGDGTFERRSREAGLGDSRWGASACFFDFDGDGALDLYVATYLHYDPPKPCTTAAGSKEYCGPDAYRGVPDIVYRGRGDGTFVDVSEQAGVAARPNKGLGVVCADFDGDRRPDVYVANDGEANQLWINQGDGTFEEQAMLQGAAVNDFGRPEAGMGIAAGDADGDGELDLFVTHLNRETNTLYRRRGGGFLDATGTAGLGPASLGATGFGTAFFDADNDGDLDLAVANGRVRREVAAGGTQGEAGPEVSERLREYAERNLFFINDGQGGFEDASDRAGDFTAVAEISRGLMVGDLDGDGALDLVVTQTDGPARIFHNELPERGHWLAVRAVDPRFHREALGALVEVRAGDRRWRRPVLAAQSYLSAMPTLVHFGLGPNRHVDAVVVDWPDGLREAFPGGAADRLVELRRGSGEAL